MKVIIILLILSVNMGYATAVATKMSFAEQMSLNRQLQVDRYTAYKANATVEEINPLLVITQINFPSEAKTVYDAIEHALQRSGYRVDWRQSAEAYDIFSELEMPAVHRKLNLMTLKDAITTLAGDAWQILVDSVNRKLVIRLLDSVTWQIADNSHIGEPLTLQRGTSVPLGQDAQINDETVKFTEPVRTSAPSFEYENPSLSMRQATSETQVVYRDVLAEPSHHAALPNQPSIDSAVFSEDRIPTNNNADSDNGMSNIRHVQYIPGHVNPHDTKRAETDKHISDEAHTDKNLWSVQSAITAKEGVGSLDEAVIVHYDSISVKELIEILIPEGWVVHYEISDAILKQKLVSHAESSRRSALLSLFKELNLKALFYPGQAVVLVAEKEPRAQSFSYDNSPPFKTLENRDLDTLAEDISKTPDASQSQLEVDTILHSAKMIKNLMDEMEVYAK